jgi:hypothetical protein
VEDKFFNANICHSYRGNIKNSRLLDPADRELAGWLLCGMYSTVSELALEKTASFCSFVVWRGFHDLLREKISLFMLSGYSPVSWFPNGVPCVWISWPGYWCLDAGCSDPCECCAWPWLICLEDTTRCAEDAPSSLSHSYIQFIQCTP